MEAKASTANVTMGCELFQTESHQSPKDSGRNFELPPYCLKEFKIGGLPQKELSLEITKYELGVVSGRNLAKPN